MGLHVAFRVGGASITDLLPLLVENDLSADYLGYLLNVVFAPS